MTSAARTCIVTSEAQNIGSLFLMLLLWLCICAGCDADTNGLLRHSAVLPAVPMVLNVRVMPAEYSERVEETVVCFGVFQPTREASLTFSQGGMVQEVRVERGQKVTQGQLLANFNQQTIVQQRQAAEDAHQSALAELNLATPAQRPNVIAKINSLNAQRNALDAELAKGQLKAPFAGIIARQNIQTGDFVSPQMPAFILMEEGSPLVRIQLDQPAAAALESDTTLWIGHNGSARPAKIKQRSFLRGPVSGEQLLLELQEPLTVDQWKYAEVVEVRCRRNTRDSGYWLPLSAIHDAAGDSWSVLVAEKQSLQSSPSSEAGQLSENPSAWVAVRRDCQVQRYADGRVLVNASDLDRALLIIEGGHRLVAGQAVKPVFATASSTGADVQKGGP